MKNSPVFIFCFFLLFQYSSIIGQNLVPNFLVEDGDDNEYLFLDLFDENKNYIVEISASWCGWCYKELINWKTCHRKWKNDYDIEIIVLSTDGTAPEDKETMLGWFEEEGFEYHLYFAEIETFENHFEISGYPTNFLINKEKYIVDTIPGYSHCYDMELEIENHFEQKKLKNDNEINTEEIKIIYTGNNILVDTKRPQEEIDIYLFSIEGKLIYKANKKPTNEFIKIPQINELFVIKVKGHNWEKSQIIK